MSAYRSLPYLLKPYFEVSTDEFLGGNIFYSDNWIWPVCTNYGFYDRLSKEGLEFSDVENEIIIIHLFGLHHPFGTNEECKEKENASKEENIYGLKLLVDTYFDELKKNEMYDRSTIIVTSDHGGMLDEEDMFPILLVKMAGEKHDSLQISDIQVDSKDFDASILQIIGDEDYSDFGLSIFENSGEDRNRVFFRKLDSDEYIRYEYRGKNIRLLEKMNNER